MHCAAYLGYTAVVEVLICARADIMARIPDGRTAVHLACAEGQDEVVCALLHHGANPDASTPEQIKPLDLAMSAKHHKVIQSLRDAGASFS